MSFRKTISHSPGAPFGRLCGALLLAFGMCLPQSPTAAASALENKVKAAYLYNFTKFVQWPSRGEGPITVCVLGARDLGELLGELAARRAAGAFHVVNDPASDMGRCQILYIDSSVDNIPQVMRAVTGKQVLTVSDLELFTRRGGVVGLFSERGKLRFEINVTTARDANIKISAKLLELSKVVE
jgi:hypothetical protein